MIIGLLGKLNNNRSPRWLHIFFHSLGAKFRDLIDIEEKVVLENPKLIGKKPHYKLPVLWTWIKRFAENNVERTKLLSNVYEIKTIPEGFTGKNKEQWYEYRNEIAHGREEVIILLPEYIEAHVFIIKSMLYVFEQCRKKFHLII